MRKKSNLESVKGFFLDSKIEIALLSYILVKVILIFNSTVKYNKFKHLLKYKI